MNFLRKTVSLIPGRLQVRQASVNTYARAADQIFDKVRKLRETADAYEPSKLLVVTRINSLYGRPYWEKKICELMGLSSSREERRLDIRKEVGTYVVVPNTPHVCKLLWRIKHLVAVKPVTFPDGLPIPGEFTGTHLDRYGVFRIDKSLKVDPQRLVVDPEFEKTKLDGKEIAKPSHLRWLNSI